MVNISEYIEEYREKALQKGYTSQNELRKLYIDLTSDIDIMLNEMYLNNADMDGNVSYNKLLTSGAYDEMAESLYSQVSDTTIEAYRIIEYQVADSHREMYNRALKAAAAYLGYKALKSVLNGKKAPTRNESLKALIYTNKNVSTKNSLNKNAKQLITEIKQAISNGIKANDNLTVISRNVNQRISIAGNKSNEILVHQNTRAVSKGANDALKTASDEAKNLGISGIMAKTWRNMADERVRPNQRYRTKKGWKTTRAKNSKANHIKMEGQTVGIDEEFDLGHGIKTLLPRESGDPSNDINCRCYVEYNFMTVDEFAKKTGRSIDEVQKSFGNAEKSVDNSVKSGIIETGGKYRIGSNEWIENQRQRDNKAADFYNKFSKADNAKQIAEVSGFTEKEIEQIKAHVFTNEHILYDGVGKFYPNYDMAVAFKRLEDGNPIDRDILLLKHELYESQCEKKYNLTASEAHAMAKEKYDWESVIDGLNEGDGEKDGLL